MIFAKRIVPTVLACAILGACSSGGGNPTTTPLTKSFAPIEGVVAKGIVKQAKVTAHKLNADGTMGAELGSVMSSDNGSYKIELDASYDGSPIILVQKGGKMLCDVKPDCGGVSYGAEVTLPDDAVMTAVLPPVPTKVGSDTAVVKGHITPFTHMAAERVKGLIEEGKALDANLVASAQSEISNLFGFNVAEATPRNVFDEKAVGAASDQEKALMAYMAGVGKMAFDPEYKGIAAFLKNFGEELKDGKIINRGTAGSTISLKDITNAVKDQIQNNDKITDPSGTITTVEAKALEGNAGKIVDPEPTPTPGLSDLEKGKALVGTMRTWMTQIKKNDKNALIKPSKEFTKRAYESFAVMDAIEQVGPSLIDAVNVAAKVWDEKDGKDGTYYKGGYTVTLANGGDSVTVVNKNDDHGADVHIKGAIVTPNDRTKVTQIQGAYYGSITKGSSKIVVPSDKSMSLNAKFKKAINMKTEDDFSAYKNHLDYMDVNAPSLDVHASEGTGTKIVDYKGSMNGKFQLTNRKHKGLGGEFYWPYPTQLTINGTYSNAMGDQFQGLMNVGLTDKSMLDVDKAIEDDGEKASNYAKVSGSLNFDIMIQGLPKAKISLTGSRDQFKTGEAKATVSWNNNSMMIDAKGIDSNLNFKNADVVFSDLTGAKLTLKHGSKTSGTVEVNGTKIGDIKESSTTGVTVHYTDGQVESLY